MKTRLLFVVLLVATTASLAWAAGSPVQITAQTRGAGRVVVATVADTHVRFDRSARGDQVLVTDTTLVVEETLKGPSDPRVDMTMASGTVGDLTLSVSDMPRLKAGDRAVVFMREEGGRNVPQGRGAGIVKLDASDRARDLGMSLDDIRRAVQAGR